MAILFFIELDELIRCLGLAGFAQLTVVLDGGMVVVNACAESLRQKLQTQDSLFRLRGHIPLIFEQIGQLFVTLGFTQHLNQITNRCLILRQLTHMIAKENDGLVRFIQMLEHEQSQHALQACVSLGQEFGFKPSLQKEREVLVTPLLPEQHFQSLNGFRFYVCVSSIGIGLHVNLIELNGFVPSLKSPCRSRAFQCQISPTLYGQHGICAGSFLLPRRCLFPGILIPEIFNLSGPGTVELIDGQGALSKIQCPREVTRLLVMFRQSHQGIQMLWVRFNCLLQTNDGFIFSLQTSLQDSRPGHPQTRDLSPLTVGDTLAEHLLHFKPITQPSKNAMKRSQTSRRGIRIGRRLNGCLIL